MLTFQVSKLAIVGKAASIVSCNLNLVSSSTSGSSFLAFSTNSLAKESCLSKASIYSFNNWLYSSFVLKSPSPLYLFKTLNNNSALFVVLSISLDILSRTAILVFLLNTGLVPVFRPPVGSSSVGLALTPRSSSSSSSSLSLILGNPGLRSTSGTSAEEAEAEAEAEDTLGATVLEIS